MKSMTNLTIRIPEGLRKELESLCRQQQRPLATLIRDSLRRYVTVERFRDLRRKSLPFAKAQGLLTDEDVFKAIS